MKKCAKTVFVIEDDEAIRESISMILTQEGFIVKTAVNGRDGLNQLKAHSDPCLILLDLMMPEMNGWEFLEAVKHTDTVLTIPVAIMSAAIDPNRKPTHVVSVIRKPFDIDTLIKMVHRYCDPEIGEEK